jgi:hypothetical protein
MIFTPVDTNNARSIHLPMRYRPWSAVREPILPRLCGGTRPKALPVNERKQLRAALRGVPRGRKVRGQQTWFVARDFDA